MKKVKIGILTLTLSLVIGCSNVTSLIKHDPDFRNVTWGMDKNEVIQSETADAKKVDYYIDSELKKVYPKSNEIFYQTKLANEEVVLAYEFDKEKLASASYEFKKIVLHDFSGGQEARIRKFMDSVEADLKNKYGEPNSANNIGSANLAIKEVIWNRDRTVIRVLDDAKTGQTGVVYFTDKKYLDQRKSESEKSDDKKL